jgi:hypothetical protein
MFIKIVYNEKTGEIPEHIFNEKDGTVSILNLRGKDIDEYIVSMVDARDVDFEIFYVDLEKKHGKEKIKYNL